MKRGSLWKTKSERNEFMAEKNWTDEQVEAIETKYTADGESCNILVNAAAGSGKTAVLVERIIKKLIPTDKNQNPIDVNRLLVVTFTNAAAAEMKERILNALTDEEEKAAADGDTVLESCIKRQTSLLYDADITTIDAFCMKMIRENFHLLGLDPNFKIADNAQLMLIADEAMEEVFEECYEEENESFLRLTEIYSGGNDDSAVAEVIYEIYDFIQAMPEPESWLSEKVDMYHLNGGVEKSPWIKVLENQKDRLSLQACGFYEKALRYMAETLSFSETDAGKIIEQNMPGEPNIMQYSWGTCYEIICMEYFAAKKIYNSDWNGCFDILKNFTFERWGKAARVRDKEYEITDKEMKSFVKTFRDKGKDILSKLSDIFLLPLKDIERQIAERVYPTAQALAEIELFYDKKFKEKKSAKNILDFSDVEHLCLKLFSENDEICAVLKDKYEEILMDEYQDTNGLQEEIFSKISKGDNLFMVGDMKQSIYRFRRSDPMIFKSKNDTFLNKKGAKDRKIILSKNFRSRKEVLDSVNDVFEAIMSEDVGDVCYDDEQRLNNGDTTYENVNDKRCGGYLSECYLIGNQNIDEDEESIEKDVLEARFIAKKINELKKNGFMVRDGNEYRKIRNKDITILMSSYKNVSEVYISELNNEGIECFAPTGGYFERNEIRMIMSLIRVIQNPYRDIPILAVLRSPVFRFSDDELVLIREKSQEGIYSCVKCAALEEDNLGKKCAEFLMVLSRWREYSKYMGCARLLWTLYEETGIYAFAGALYGGEEAQANLRLLFERAKQYESSGYKGLFHFVRYMEKLERREEDLSAAKLVGEGHDVVKIMTIHKSKGLEFPVVFLAGCCKRFNIKPKRILLHKELGLGLEEINIDENYSVETVAKKSVAIAEKSESISEEERKLYVAMTRAKEKLFVTGVVNAGIDDLKKYEKHLKELISTENGQISSELVNTATCFMDWVAPVAMEKKQNWNYEIVSNELDSSDVGNEYEPEEKFDVPHMENFKYPYEILSAVPTKVSVTALKSLGNILDFSKSDSAFSDKPEFLKNGNNITSVEKGTAIHYIMQKIVPQKNVSAEYVSEFIDKLVRDGELGAELAEAVDISKIVAFYKSNLAERLLKSKKVVREATFETEIPLSKFENYKNSEEIILLQGIIDCYFEEEDGIVIIDYKSDYYKNINEIVEKYISQLNWYQYAVEKITGKKVKEKYIYMFHGNEAVRIDA